MAVGVAVANAILLVTFAERYRREGRSASEAAVEAARTRMRPIVMTSLAMIAGMSPVALGLDSDGVATPASQRVPTVPAGARVFMLDEIAIYQAPVDGLAPEIVPVAARCPVPRTALLRVPLDLRRREQ